MPPGYLFEVQKALGKALKTIHKLGGFKVRYTLVTDRTTNPPTTSVLDIFMNPTPTVKQRERLGGRWNEILGSAANLAREAQPVFVVSREDLKVAGVFQDPTTDDTFRALDAAGSPTGATFYVQQTTPVGFLPGGFLLLVRAKFHDAPGG